MHELDLPKETSENWRSDKETTTFDQVGSNT